MLDCLTQLIISILNPGRLSAHSSEAVFVSIPVVVVGTEAFSGWSIFLKAKTCQPVQRTPSQRIEPAIESLAGNSLQMPQYRQSLDTNRTPASNRLDPDNRRIKCRTIDTRVKLLALHK